MNAATRKKLLAYAIPIDLVVLATGLGLLVPGIPSVVIIGVYVVAVAVSAWKSGWTGAFAAMALSSVLLLLLFGTTVPRDQIGWLIAAGIVVSIPLAPLHARRIRRRMERETNVLLLPAPAIAGPRTIEEVAAEAIEKKRDAARKRNVVPPPQKYDVSCANCRVAFDAADADWCSCLTRDRTVVCTNCLTCFCKSAPAYKEIFWSNAPPQLLDRKAAELRRQSLAIAAISAPSDVRRPLVMLVDSDADNQAIMQRVCANLGYGAVSSDGQDALSVARSYRPNLILADAILPRLDGRELCRLLKEDPAFAATKFVVMTGLYTDMKFNDESMERFGIDDCLAKPVSITDVINLLQRHLEGVLDLPAQENLYELHRKPFGGPVDSRTAYEIACVTCGDLFDAVKASWCACTDGDHTLACEHCGGCFCDAPDYRQRFWAGAPAVLFERKTIVDPRNGTPASDDKRPLLAVIEDDASIQLLARTIASTLGYGFAGYASANDASMQRADLILVDALILRHDSRDVARRLKNDPATASSKVVVMSGRASDPEFRHDAAARFKADDCLPKPLAAADVIDIIKKYLPRADTTG